MTLIGLGYTRATMKTTESYFKFLVNLKKFSQFELQTETRLHEVGITSNRKSACCGEHVNWPCTHRPSHAES